ncbi:hypothetical protein [Leifsonia kafniensis]
MGMKLSNATVRLVDLALDTTVLDGLEATDVNFIGPAVMALLPGTGQWNDVTFAEPIDSLLWDIDDQRLSITGAVGVSNFVFTRCTFSSIGIAAQRSQMPELVKLISVS